MYSASCLVYTSFLSLETYTFPMISRISSWQKILIEYNSSALTLYFLDIDAIIASNTSLLGNPLSAIYVLSISTTSAFADSICLTYSLLFFLLIIQFETKNTIIPLITPPHMPTNQEFRTNSNIIIFISII